EQMAKPGVNRRAVLAGASAAATSLATGVRLARAADPVKVGVLFPLTGNAAAAGQASKAAVEIAADIVNNAHPELASIPLAKDAGLPGLGREARAHTFIASRRIIGRAATRASSVLTGQEVTPVLCASVSSRL